MVIVSVRLSPCKAH